MKKVIVILAGKLENHELNLQHLVETSAKLNFVSCEIAIACKEKDKEIIQGLKLPDNVHIILESNSFYSKSAAIFNAVQFFTQKNGEVLFSFLPVEFNLSDNEHLFTLLPKVNRIASQSDKIILFGRKISHLEAFGNLIFSDMQSGIENSSFYSLKKIINVKENQSLELENFVLFNVMKSLGIFVGKSSSFLKVFLGATVPLKTEAQKQELLSLPYEISVLSLALPKLLAIQVSEQNLKTKIHSKNAKIKTTQAFSLN